MGTLPTDLVRAEDVRGMVHCHTTWSDGRASVEEMARAAEALGMEYLTITDHSQSAGYAGGLSPDRLRRQWDEIDRVQEKVRDPPPEGHRGRHPGGRSARLARRRCWSSSRWWWPASTRA